MVCRAPHHTEAELLFALAAFSKVLTQTILLLEIPSFDAGLIAFLCIFLLMWVLYCVLRTEREKTMPELKNSVGPRDCVKFENPLSTSDAPFLATVTLVTLELIVDALIIASALQGGGSIMIGTMLAIAVFIAAAILLVYRSAFMNDVFVRKPRLEKISAGLLEGVPEVENE
jgi:uncharacterized membrane protein (DUF485 family)